MNLKKKNVANLHFLVAVCPDYYNIASGGSSQLIIILHRGEGSLRTQKLYYVINGQPLMPPEHGIRMEI